MELSIPLIRSESATFCWQPKVRTQQSGDFPGNRASYQSRTRTPYSRWRSSSCGVMVLIWDMKRLFLPVDDKVVYTN